MPDPHTVGSLPLRLCWIHTPLGYPPLSHAGFQASDPHHAGIPAPHLRHRLQDHRDPRHRLCQTPAQSRSHSSLGYPPHPPSPQPTTLQALLSPSYTCDHRTPATQTPPDNQALSGTSSMWNDWSQAPLGQIPAWCIHQTTRNPTIQSELATVLQASQITTPRGSHLCRH
jgi:hypothetical protein